MDQGSSPSRNTSLAAPSLQGHAVPGEPSPYEAAAFQRQGRLACGLGVRVGLLPHGLVEEAATLLNTCFAESLGYISMYRSYLQSQIRQYLRQHLPLFPKTVLLAAFATPTPETGRDDGGGAHAQRVQGAGRDGSRTHDPGPLPSEERLVGIAELSLAACTRTRTLTLNPPAEHAYVSNMAVDPGTRRQGIGSFLLAAAEELAWSMGHSQVFLHSRVDDEAGERLYTRAGYRIVGEDPGLVRLIGMDPRYLMRKPSERKSQGRNCLQPFL